MIIKTTMLIALVLLPSAGGLAAQDHKKTNRSAPQQSGIVTVGGVKIDLASPPKGLALHPNLGILAAEAVQGKIIHRSGKIVWVPRATITPKGDYLVLFPHDRGQWYQGKTWTLLPGKRPAGWHLKKFDRMDEGTVVSLGGEKAALFIRTAEGHIWESRTDDDGKSWSEAKPTTMVHPDAPPMIFKLGDGKTLISFIHNRYDPKKPHFDKAARNELWCSISKDQGRTWSEPRFVFAGATGGKHIHSNSYIDMFADGTRIHIFLGQYGRQLLYLNFDESDIAKFLTENELAAVRESSG
ncbi:MAG: exo-alpha-sialidase [Pirellulales bacterium]|nr:exo-alpha-sialidase [Pirellulales bacterium]